MNVKLLAGAAVLTLLTAGCGPAGEPATSQTAAFRECATCHTAAPPDTPAGAVRLVGPNLWGVYGAEAGQIEGYAYSPALKNSGVVWDDAALDAYIENPQRFIRNNRMSYPGERDPEKRREIIAYMKTLQ